MIAGLVLVDDLFSVRTPHADVARSGGVVGPLPESRSRSVLTSGPSAGHLWASNTSLVTSATTLSVHR